ncbi:MAG: methyltransferase domain-containing protein [Chloroflexi bacterium]|nr:methyltransferase domain-containing protein [Chloroflexota bacterium]
MEIERLRDWRLACPVCRTPLLQEEKMRFVCPEDGRIYPCIDGIWRFLLPERAVYYAQFVQEYETVRLAEGRQSDDPAYYRALPFQDLSGQMTAVWRERARTFRLLLSKVVEPLTMERERPLRILDLGAGNGWLSYQLAKRGHEVTAVDLTINPFDGLGVHLMYDAAFLPLQAEYTRLPLTDEMADMTIFNASFHYAESYEETLAEARRVTEAHGRIVIADSPLYRNPENGRRMVREREAAFQAQYGFPSNALASENFLWYDRLDELAQTIGANWTSYWSVPDWRRYIRYAKARLRRQREPARFPLIVFHK